MSQTRWLKLAHELDEQISVHIAGIGDDTLQEQIALMLRALSNRVMKADFRLSCQVDNLLNYLKE